MPKMPDYISFPHCGKQVTSPTQGGVLGRKPLDTNVTDIRDALRSRRDIARAASSLGCSRSHVYAALKTHGTTPKEVILGK